MTYTARPVLNGTQLPRPSAVNDTFERVGTSVQLANGGIRGYTVGRRRVITLSYSKATEATLNALRAAAAGRFVSYTHQDGDAFAAEVDEPQTDAIPGTEPTRFAVSIVLRDQAVR